MSKNQYIAKLNEMGQSIWYDNLSRDVLRSGRLQTYIDSGVSGLTSNPTIFKKAIADTDHYDSEIRDLGSSGLGAEEICDELMLRDVGTAADMLRPTFEASSGSDGFASIEVSPLLAHDAEKTVDAAKTIWRKLGRANVMIKVPATEQGIPAIESLLVSGINVNVTLIFSVQTYEAVANAFIKALELRLQKGETLRNINSVASFFVSRVDSIFEDAVKRKADQKVFQAYLGNLGVANSKLAFASFLRLFETPRFFKLAGEGANVQRPLWASTGVKNPAYQPLLYVENLVGRHTVNTLPPQTLDQLLTGVSVKARIDEDLESAAGLISPLGEKGIDFSSLLDQLQRDGVRLFADAYNELVQSVARKKESLLRA